MVSIRNFAIAVCLISIGNVQCSEKSRLDQKWQARQEIMRALQFKEFALAEKLINDQPSLLRDTEVDDTVLNNLVSAQMFDAVEFLIRKDPSLMLQKGRDDWIPLMMLINVTDNNFESPGISQEFLAKKFALISIFLFLNKSQLYIADKAGYTPLLQAAWRSTRTKSQEEKKFYDAVMGLMIQNGAHVQRTIEDGRTLFGILRGDTSKL